MLTSIECLQDTGWSWVVVRHMLLSLHAAVRPSTLWLLVAFDANGWPLPSGGLNTSRRPPFAAPIIGWLLCCCLPPLPAYVIACHCATVNALIAGYFHRQLLTAALRWSLHQPPIEAGQDTPDDMTWVAEGMTKNSLIWVTSGLYNRKKAIDLCGVGWIIFCTKTGFR